MAEKRMEAALGVAFCVILLVPVFLARGQVDFLSASGSFWLALLAVAAVPLLAVLVSAGVRRIGYRMGWTHWNNSPGVATAWVEFIQRERWLGVVLSAVVLLTLGFLLHRNLWAIAAVIPSRPETVMVTATHLAENKVARRDVCRYQADIAIGKDSWRRVCLSAGIYSRLKVGEEQPARLKRFFFGYLLVDDSPWDGSQTRQD